MRLQRFGLGAVLGVILWGLVPAPAAAGGERNGARFAPQQHGQIFDRPEPRDRFSEPRDRFDPSGQGRNQRERLQLATRKLRKSVDIFVQKPACHPRGKPWHDPFGWGKYTSVGFSPAADGWDDRERRGRGDPGGPDHGHDGDHGDHHGHGPPFCPSPH
jgi:hypothetical protein